MVTKQVWKWVLSPRDLSTIQVPTGAKFLHVGEQTGCICIWALVDPAETKREERTLRIAGTGHNISNGKFNYIGTVHLDGGSLIFHVFEALQ
jgi:hypothetical protein